MSARHNRTDGCTYKGCPLSRRSVCLFKNPEGSSSIRLYDVGSHLTALHAGEQRYCLIPHASLSQKKSSCSLDLELYMICIDYEGGW